MIRVLRPLFRPLGVFTPVSVRYNSSFKDLLFKEPKKKNENEFILNEMVNNITLNEADRNHLTPVTPPETSPRDIAKTIRMHGPVAGRTVDVHNNNMGKALGGLNSLANASKIRYLKQIQSRFIRPAKYTKQKRREWWRRKFAVGFKDLMGQVNDARRRGY